MSPKKSGRSTDRKRSKRTKHGQTTRIKTNARDRAYRSESAPRSGQMIYLLPPSGQTIYPIEPRTPERVASIREEPMPTGVVHIIEGPTGLPHPATQMPEYILLPRAAYQVLLDRLEDLEDSACVRAGEARGGPSPDAWPAALVDRLLAGDHPARLWREQRGLTLAALAKRSGVPASYISEIERRKKPGSVKALHALATALQLSLDDLVLADPLDEAVEGSRRTWAAVEGPRARATGVPKRPRAGGRIRTPGRSAAGQIGKPARPKHRGRKCDLDK